MQGIKWDLAAGYLNRKDWVQPNEWDSKRTRTLCKVLPLTPFPVFGGKQLTLTHIPQPPEGQKYESCCQLAASVGCLQVSLSGALQILRICLQAYYGILLNLLARCLPCLHSTKVLLKCLGWYITLTKIVQTDGLIVAQYNRVWVARTQQFLPACSSCFPQWISIFKFSWMHHRFRNPKHCHKTKQPTLQISQ